MNIIQSLLWVVLPYSSIAILIMGYIWQYEDKTNKSEKLYYKKGLGIALTSIVIGTGAFSLFTAESEISAISWAISLIQLNPNIPMLEASSIITKIHLISTCMWMLFLPTTKFIKFSLIKTNRRFITVPLLLLLLGV